MSSSVSLDVDMSLRSPINSSVSCRRAFLMRQKTQTIVETAGHNVTVCEIVKVENNKNLDKPLTILQV